MNQLTRCVLAADAAGVSYGKYMALEYEQNVGMPIQPDNTPNDTQQKVCKNCGKTFHLNGRNSNTMYCDEFCYRQMNARRAKQKAREKAGITDDDIRVCPTCGKEFRLNGRHASCKYCSDACNPRAKYGRRRKNA